MLKKAILNITTNRFFILIMITLGVIILSQPSLADGGSSTVIIEDKGDFFIMRSSNLSLTTKTYNINKTDCVQFSFSGDEPWAKITHEFNLKKAGQWFNKTTNAITWEGIEVFGNNTEKAHVRCMGNATKSGFVIKFNITYEWNISDNQFNPNATGGFLKITDKIHTDTTYSDSFFQFHIEEIKIDNTIDNDNASWYTANGNLSTVEVNSLVNNSRDESRMSCRLGFGCGTNGTYYMFQDQDTGKIVDGVIDPNGQTMNDTFSIIGGPYPYAKGNIKQHGGSLAANNDYHVVMWWDDPPAGDLEDDSFSCVATTLEIGQSTNCTGQYDNGGQTDQNWEIWLTDDSDFNITRDCGPADLKVIDTGFTAPCDSESNGTVICNVWDTQDDDIQITWELEACSPDLTNTIKTNATSNDGGLVNLDVTDVIETVIAPLSTVTFQIFSDLNYSDNLKFFDKNDIIFIEAIILDTSGNNASGTVVANFSKDGIVEQIITLNRFIGATYRGNWTTNSSTTTGVYKINVTATNGSVVVDAENNIHIYNLTNVAAYNFDFDNDGINELVMENKNLVVVFDSRNMIEFLYQKGENLSYSLGTIGDNNIFGQGEINSETKKGVPSDLALIQTGESLSSATLEGNISLGGGVDNELVLGGLGVSNNVSVLAYNATTNRYNTVWSNSSRADLVYDIEIGDVTHDGVNEIITVHGTFITAGEIAVWSYNATEKSWYLLWNDDTFSARVFNVRIGNTDNESKLEFVAAELVSGGAVIVYENDTVNATGFSSTIIHECVASNPFAIDVADINNNGISEIFIKCSDLGTTMLVYEFNNATGTYDQIATFDTSMTLVDHIVHADVDNDGLDELVFSGNDFKVHVADNVSGGYSIIFSSQILGSGSDFANAAGAADLNNDGRIDFWTFTDKMIFFENQSGTFVNTWNGSDNCNPSGGHAATSGDADNDGLNEAFVRLGTCDVLLFENNTGGPGFNNSFNFTGASMVGMTVGDADTDALAGNSLSFNITMDSEDVDYLIYKLFGISFLENLTINSPIAGTIGSSVSDDRYRLENNSDANITSLSQDAWSDFNQSASNYSLVYDNITSPDSTNNSVIAFVRFNETVNITYNSSSLWNDSSDLEGLKLRYSTTDAASTDVIYFLLAFTNGSSNTIDQWMGDIRGGTFPSPNFFTPPSAADTCTYTSGDWVVDCSDNCVVTSAVNVGGNDVIITGTGTFIVDGIGITNFNRQFFAGTSVTDICTIRRINGGVF